MLVNFSVIFSYSFSLKVIQKIAGSCLFELVEQTDVEIESLQFSINDEITNICCKTEGECETPCYQIRHLKNNKSINLEEKQKSKQVEIFEEDLILLKVENVMEGFYNVSLKLKNGSMHYAENVHISGKLS